MKKLLFLSFLITCKAFASANSFVEIINYSDRKAIVSNQNGGKNEIKPFGFPDYRAIGQGWFDVVPAQDDQPTIVALRSFNVPWHDSPYNSVMIINVVGSWDELNAVGYKGHEPWLNHATIYEFYNHGNRRIMAWSELAKPTNRPSHYQTQRRWPQHKPKPTAVDNDYYRVISNVPADGRYYRIVINKDYSVSLETASTSGTGSLREGSV